MSKKLTCMLALLGCLAAPAAKAQSGGCNVADASVSVWNGLNETIGFVFDYKAVKIFTAFSKIFRFETENRLMPACQTQAAIEEILAETKDQATDMYNAAINRKVIDRFQSLKNNSSIDESYSTISDTISTLAGLQSEAYTIGSSAKGAYLMSAMAKLTLLQHRHQLAHTFDDSQASHGIYGTWFSTATDIITNAEQTLAEMTELERRYKKEADDNTKVWAWSAYDRTQVFHKIYAQSRKGPVVTLYSNEFYCPEAPLQIAGAPVIFACLPLLKEKQPGLDNMVADVRTNYLARLNKEFLDNKKFGSLKDSVSRLIKQVEYSLNKRSLLFRSRFKDNVTDVATKQKINDGKISTELRAEAYDNLTIRVADDLIIQSKCSNGTVRDHKRGGVALVAFAANVSKYKKYGITLQDDDGSALAYREVTVSPGTKYYSVNFLPSPYYLNVKKAPIAYWVKIDALTGGNLDVAEIYAFGPDASAGMITSQSSNAAVHTMSNKAVDGAVYQFAGGDNTYPGALTNYNYASRKEWWEGVLAKPTKINYIKFVLGNAHVANGGTMKYDIQLHGQNGLVFDTFTITVPAGVREVTVYEGLCGQIPEKFVTKVKIFGQPGYTVNVVEVEVDPIAYASD